MPKILNLRKKMSQGTPSIRKEVPYREQEGHNQEKKVIKTQDTKAQPVKKTEQFRKSLTKEVFTWDIAPRASMQTKKVFLLVALVVFVGVILLLLFEINISLIVIFILSFVVMATYKLKPASSNTITIDENGIRINNTIRYFKDIKSFWIDYSPGGIKEISFELRKWYMPYLKIPLGQQNPVKIHNFLILFIPEEEHEASLIDTFLNSP